MRISDWSSDVCSSDLHEIFFVVPPDREVEKVAQRVDHRHADAVQPARDLISIVVARIVEFSAGVELGHDDLGRRDAFFLVDSGRDAAAVILRSEEHTSELQSLMRISYAVFCLKKKT